jgi:hypothetical protein
VIRVVIAKFLLCIFIFIWSLLNYIWNFIVYLLVHRFLKMSLLLLYVIDQNFLWLTHILSVLYFKCFIIHLPVIWDFIPSVDMHIIWVLFYLRVLNFPKFSYFHSPVHRWNFLCLVYLGYRFFNFLCFSSVCFSSSLYGQQKVLVAVSMFYGSNPWLQ